jgi:hypothetical protein
VSVGLYSGVSGLALGTGLYKNVSGLWSGASGLVAGFGGGSPFGGASLYLDFLAGAPLDSRITFTRGSNATLVDSTGKITYAPANLLLQSQTFDNASWTKQGSTVTANTTVAPDDTSTADTIEAPVGEAGAPRVAQRPAITGSTTYTVSSYFKASGTNFAFLSLRTSNTNWAGAEFNLSTGTVSRNPSTGNVAYVDADIRDAGNGWYRCTLTATPTDTVAAGVGFIFFGSSDGTSAFIGGQPAFTNTGTETVFIWGAQLEPVTYQTTAGPYVATTTAAYYGPRFDYDPVTLAAKGLLIEEQRTNLLLQSQTFDNASWSKTSGVTVTPNTTVAPDGTTTADTIDANGLAGAVLNQGVVFTGDGTKSVSVFLKAGTSGTSTFFVRDITVTASRGIATITWTGGVPSAVASAGGTIEGVENYGNGWYRIKLIVTGVIAANSNVVRLQPDSAAGTGTVIAWGAQAENGAFATSYIPTVASQVTRSADVATMTGTNFSSWYNQSEGTLVAEFTFLPRTLSGTAVIAYNGSANGRWSYLSNASARMFDGTNTAAAGNIATPTAVNKTASALSSAGMAISLNGAAAVTSAYVGTFGPQDALNIGSQSGAASINGHIRQIAYYNTRLPDATLQALTA